METIIEMVVLRSTMASRLASLLHLPHMHSHLLVSLNTTLLRSNLLPFAIYSIVSLSTTLSLIPMPDSYSITPKQTLFSWNQANSGVPSARSPQPVTP